MIDLTPCSVVAVPSLLLLEVELMETVLDGNSSFITSALSLLLLEVELMETIASRRPPPCHQGIASIIGSGINGNYRRSRMGIGCLHQSLLLLEVELMET